MLFLRYLSLLHRTSFCCTFAIPFMTFWRPSDPVCPYHSLYPFSQFPLIIISLLRLPDYGGNASSLESYPAISARTYRWIQEPRETLGVDAVGQPIPPIPAPRYKLTFCLCVSSSFHLWCLLASLFPFFCLNNLFIHGALFFCRPQLSMHITPHILL